MNNVSSSEVTRQLLYCFLAGAWYQPLTFDLVTLTHNKLTGNEASTEVLTLVADIQSELAKTSNQEDSFFNLFEGLAEPLIPLCSSWYISGGFFELPLLKVRKSLNELGYIRTDNNALTEDHISSLFETMAMLIEDQPLEVQSQFYHQHINNWLAGFIEYYQKQLPKENNTEAYAAVLQLLIQFEKSENNLLMPLAALTRQKQAAVHMEN